ncbi:LacI family transcriptional regulator [Rhizobium sp. P38BS-XIX]|uniref:LacI family DNA-binding transcriptional regulator n=1 Tax=Rhizobium sp. P38BS-XIX TaxID=2726740 RepID=UPI0014570933|nr:LacI family DNA-binding transcriptional regulator [Rhizobium sp. P38BS-XIX]NLS00740.1 LacI family transcriptional regulator [Rhizobium sp. P38BS-XIX]
MPKRKPTKANDARIPTMADIARIAGVSASTVSRALAGLPPITEETRQRVAQAAKEAGYAVNRHARSLRLKRSKLILVLIPNLANPNFPDLLMHIDQAAYDCGYDIMIAHTAVDPHRSDRYVDELLAGSIDGVLLTANYCPPRLLEYIHSGRHLPIVRTLSPTPSLDGISGVQIDEVKAAYDVVDHLAKQGYKHIAHLGGPTTEAVAIARKKGWEMALADHGLSASRDLFIQAGFRVEDGRQGASKIKGLARRPDAIFCSNDESAYGLIAALKEQGLRVPQDIAIAGFDDLSFSNVLDPPLTTVRLPRHEMAELSVRKLKALIEDDADNDITTLAHELVVRASSLKS